MKTLLVTALVAVAAVAAVAIGACSSDNTSKLVTNAAGTAQQGDPCTTSADCEKTLVCGFAYNNDAGSSCTAKGICTATGPCSYLPACSCASPSVPLGNVCFNGVYATAQVSGKTDCVAASGDGGTTTTPKDSGTGGSTTGG